jgi:hypothetical protein
VHRPKLKATPLLKWHVIVRVALLKAVHKMKLWMRNKIGLRADHRVVCIHTLLLLLGLLMPYLLTMLVEEAISALYWR